MNPSKIIMIPLAMSRTAINELQPGAITCCVFPENESHNTQLNWAAASAKKTSPELNPMYKGINENEKIASEASLNILPSEYFDLPAMRAGW